jgi:selenocysteine lyase/cysteine desulfurase
MAETPWPEVMAAEGQLLERLESGLRAIPGVTVYGPAAFEGRAPTTIFNLDGRDPAHVAHELAERKIAVWSGDNYACELIDALGLRERGGAVRAGVVRYTTTDDIDALLAAIQDLA